MAEEAPEMTVEKETKKDGGEDVKKLEGDEDNNKEAPAAEEIGITYNI